MKLMLGDINRDYRIDVYDIAALWAAVNGIITIDTDGDINQDGVENNKDVVRLTKHFCGLEMTDVMYEDDGEYNP